LAFGALPSLHAQSLVDLYGAARGYDASYQSAKSQFDATLAKSAQARAAILPTANFALGASRSNQEVLPASDRSYGSQTATISASQPLYRPANWASYEQGKKQVDLAQAQLQAAEQDLIVRVSQAYFDVLAAQDALATTRASKAAITEQLASAKRNFEVGTATITDTREAQARFDLATAQEIAAENDLRTKRIALDQLVGRSNITPKGMAQAAALPTPAPADAESWARLAEGDHPSVRKARLGLDVARLETEKARAAETFTLDAVGSVGATHFGGKGATIPGLNKSATVGVQLNWPLYTGGATQNRIKETLALEDKSRNDAEAARRAVTQATRQAFFGVQSGLAQVKALEAAESSSQLALEATQLGYKVGVRVNLDVLNAQTQLFQTRRDLAKARYDVILGGLKLRLASGQLKAGDVAAVNALLDR
jgi:outer membrane protein